MRSAPTLGTRAAVTGIAAALVARRNPNRVRPRGDRPVVAIALSVLPPTVVLVASMGRATTLRPRQRSALGHALVLAHVATGAVAEELAWRLPVVTAGRGMRLPVGAAAIGLFAALHAHRGRRGVAVAAVLGTGWTVAAVCDDTIFWPTVGHLAYNFVAVSTRLRTPGRQEPRRPVCVGADVQARS